jgi:hypothetical protein
MLSRWLVPGLVWLGGPIAGGALLWAALWHPQWADIPRFLLILVGTALAGVGALLLVLIRELRGFR